MKDIKWISVGVLIALLIWTVNALIIDENNPIRAIVNSNLSGVGKVITIGRLNNSIALDPAVVTDQESIRVTVNIYDNLVTYDRGGVDIKPSLAESWSVSEDGLIWLFNIRKNVFFHDGSKLDADAVVFNFSRWMDSHNPYHAGRFVYWNMIFGEFPGLVQSVRALSDDTVEIVLQKPYAPFLSTLAMPAFGIASPEAIMKYNEDLKYNPIGTGPFVFKSWDNNGNIILDKNVNYWDEKAKVDQLVFITINDSKERIRMMQSGELLIADNLTTSEIASINDNDQITLLNRSFYNIGYLAMNMNNQYLKIKNVRKAIASLIEQQEMIDRAFEASTRPASTFVPPVLWGYNEKIKSAPLDVKHALELLHSAGIEHGFKIKLLVMAEPRTYFPKPITLGEYLKEALAQAGIIVELEIKPWEEVLHRGQNGDYEMIIGGWNGDVADPDNFLYTLFSSENIKTGTISNYSFYSNDQVDSLLTLARQATDQSFRISLYREVQEIIAEDTPAIPLAHTIPTLGISKNIIGYTANFSGVEPLNYINLIKEP